MVFIFNLREFVLNSRHPGPRRVWKVGSVARWLPPLPRDPLSPAGSGPVYQTVVSCTRNDTFPSPKALEALPGQGLARGSPMGAKGTPKGTQRQPKVTPEEPKKPKVGPKGPQRTAKVTPGEQKGPQSRPKGSQGNAKSPQRKPQARQRHPWEARGTRYTFKTPDQPHSSRYVNIP